MNIQFSLEINTGNGNTALAASLNSLNPLYIPLLTVALRGGSFGDFHNRISGDIGRELDRAIDILRSDRSAFSALTEPEQNYRMLVLELLTGWREKCREHPTTIFYVRNGAIVNA